MEADTAHRLRQMEAWLLVLNLDIEGRCKGGGGSIPEQIAQLLSACPWQIRKDQIGRRLGETGCAEISNLQQFTEWFQTRPGVKSNAIFNTGCEPVRRGTGVYHLTYYARRGGRENDPHEVKANDQFILQKIIGENLQLFEALYTTDLKFGSALGKQLIKMMQDLMSAETVIGHAF
jgi:hypothetical protein